MSTIHSSDTTTTPDNIATPFDFKYAHTSEVSKFVLKQGLPGLMSVRQVATLFQTHPETIRRWEKRGMIKAEWIKKGQRKDRRFRKSEILKILDKGLSKK